MTTIVTIIKHNMQRQIIATVGFISNFSILVLSTASVVEFVLEDRKEFCKLTARLEFRISPRSDGTEPPRG
jgi:hypothetical protein